MRWSVVGSAAPRHAMAVDPSGPASAGRGRTPARSPGHDGPEARPSQRILRAPRGFPLLVIRGRAIRGVAVPSRHAEFILIAERILLVTPRRHLKGRRAPLSGD